MRRFLAIALVIIGGTSSGVFAQSDNEISERSSFKDRVYFGGGLGMGFGEITFVQVAPTMGYRITDEFSVGVGLQYKYRKDKRYVPDFKATDYGVNLFARYNIMEPFFLQAEYEYLNFEYGFFSGSDILTERRGFSSLLAGGGISQPIGSKAFFTLTALYNFSYVASDITNPYDSPIVVRGGITLGF